MFVFRYLVLISILLCACSKPPVKEVADHRKFIATKDSLFLHAPWSPLTTEMKSDFQGLKYFEYDPRFRFTGSIVIYEEPDSTVLYATRAGDVRPALKYGYFPFNFMDKEFRLQVFKMGSRKNPDKQYLFLGFTDATSGNETYGGGRYIDLEENASNNYAVDFNYAYNPYCAYNPRYSCALPPKENRLPFPVLAGEKNYGNH